MPENTENQATVENATQGETAEKERTFTQAEMEAIIGERLKRERAKYADYDEFKAKAAKFDEAEEANKSELQKAVEERDRLKAELDKRDAEREHAKKVAEVAAAMGVDEKMLARMAGDVEENAEFLKTQMDSMRYPNVPDKGEVNPPSAKKTEIPKVI